MSFTIIKTSNTCGGFAIKQSDSFNLSDSDVLATSKAVSSLNENITTRSKKWDEGYTRATQAQDLAKKNESANTSDKKQIAELKKEIADLKAGVIGNVNVIGTAEIAKLKQQIADLKVDFVGRQEFTSTDNFIRQQLADLKADTISKKTFAEVANEVYGMRVKLTVAYNHVGFFGAWSQKVASGLENLAVNTLSSNKYSVWHGKYGF